MAEVDMALGVIDKFEGATGFSLVPKNSEMEKALETLRRYNPTPSPGDERYEKKIGKLASGQWQVLYAPHMYVLQQVLEIHRISCKDNANTKARVPTGPGHVIQPSLHLGDTRRSQHHPLQRKIRVQAFWQWVAKRSGLVRL